jgi:hypothetical protein
VTILVYRLDGSLSRSVHTAVLVAEVEVDDMPANLRRFARRHGGDFAEVQYDSPVLEELATA